MKSSISVFFSIAVLLTAFGTALAGSAFTSSLDGSQETPSNTSTAVGTGSVLLNTAETQVTVTLFLTPLTASQTTAAIHGPAPIGSAGPIIFNLPNGLQRSRFLKIRHLEKVIMMI